MSTRTLQAGLARLIGIDLRVLEGALDACKDETARLADLCDRQATEIARLRQNLPAPAGQEDAKEKTVVAGRLKGIVLDLLGAYEVAQGVSGDAYCDIPQWHAMGEAFYLETLVAAKAAAIISPTAARKGATASFSRLQNGAVRRVPGAYALWGLGFEWQIEADAPFLITSALVTRALARAQDLAADPRLLAEAQAGLMQFPKVPTGAQDFPVYAPGIDFVVDNALCVWADALLTCEGTAPVAPKHRDEAKAALAWVDARYRPALGWAYCDDRPVFDLIHQTYIMGALLRWMPSSEMEGRALKTLAAFRGGSSYVDTMQSLEEDKAVACVTIARDRYLRFTGETILAVKTAPARLWSLGSILGLFAQLAQQGRYRDYWKAQIRRFDFGDLPMRFGADFRQEMHLAHGAALALTALRQPQKLNGTCE